MDKKTLLAVGISLLIWVVWQKTYLEPIQQQQQAAENLRKQQEAQVQSKAASDAALQSKSAAVENTTTNAGPAIAVKKVILENNKSQISVSNEPFAVDGWILENFSKTLGHAEDKVTLGDVAGFPSQLRVRFSDADLTKSIDQNWGTLESKNGQSAESRIETPLLRASRTFTLDETGYGTNLQYTFHFNKEVPKFVFLDLFGSPKRATDKEGSIFGQAPDKVRITYRDANGRHSQIGAQLKENQESAADVKWMGLDTRYFVMAIVPGHEQNVDLGVQVAHDEVAAVPAVRGSVVFPTDGKSDFSISTKVYFGPKDLTALKGVDPLLGDAIDYGWFTFIAIPLLQALKWLYLYVKNYGVAIIVLTFLIKMALFPLMYKSMKSMAKMSKLQPQLNALREKHKDDKERLNVEMMNFMKSNGYNPVGGCLPMVLQMPIFFALYRVLYNSMELYQAPFFGWIHDLSSPDPFFVTPVLLCGLMFLQQKISPNTAADPAQQKMMQIMPVMFGAFMLLLPSGLTIYMVVNSAVSISQQYFLNRKLGIRRAQPAVAT
jgi:YidC/Oxa1 family membrane protein insertase